MDIDTSIKNQNLSAEDAKRSARKSQIMYFRAKDVMILLTYKKDTKRQNTHQKQEAT